MKDEKIARSLMEGDAETISWCIRKYSRLLWPIAASILYAVAGDAEVEECVADTFIALWERPEQFDPTRGSLKSYLCTLVRSRAIDRYRQISRRNTVPLDEVALAAGGEMEGDFLHREERKELEVAVQSLGHPGQDILVRRYYYDQKPREIAMAMGLTVKQVDNALYRAKRQLRDILAERGEKV